MQEGRVISLYPQKYAHFHCVSVFVGNGKWIVFLIEGTDSFSCFQLFLIRLFTFNHTIQGDIGSRFSLSSDCIVLFGSGRPARACQAWDNGPVLQTQCVLGTYVQVTHPLFFMSNPKPKKTRHEKRGIHGRGNVSKPVIVPMMHCFPNDNFPVLPLPLS